MKKKIKRPFNPFWFIPVSFFFSFVGAGLLAASNYARLDNLRMKRKTILYTLIGFIIFCIFAVFILPLPLTKMLAGLLNIGVGVYLAQDQLKAYTEWKLKYELGNKEEEAEVITEIENVSKIRKRPILITILCSVGFLMLGLGGLSIVGMAIIFPEHPGNPITRDLHEVGFVPVLIFILTLILTFVGFIGYWKMRKWGLYFQLTAIIIDIGRCCFLTNETYDILTALSSIIIIGIGIAYFKQMT